MREVFQFLASNVELDGYQVPIAAIIAAGLVGISAALKNTWPGVVGGLLLFMVYFLPAPY